MTAEGFKYAVWYETESCIDQIEIFDSEEEAAQFAAGVESHSDGSVHGLQRSDGALEPASSWPRFRELRAQHHAAFMERVRNPAPRDLVDLVNPFMGNVLKVDRGEYPDWVGKQ